MIQCPPCIEHATATNVSEAVSAIKKYNPDIVFWDIEMPEENGLELFNYSDEINLDVVFTTAFDEYAVRAFECAATDYLLKPIKLKRLIQTVERIKNKSVKSLKKEQVSALNANRSHPVKKLAIPTESGFQIIDIEEISLCSADRNYTVVYMNSGEKIIVSKTLARFDSLLSDNNFFRVHRSHIVNLDRVKDFVRKKSPILILENGFEVEVSPNRREELMKFWNRLS